MDLTDNTQHLLNSIGFSKSEFNTAMDLIQNALHRAKDFINFHDIYSNELCDNDMPEIGIHSKKSAIATYNWSGNRIYFDTFILKKLKASNWLTDDVMMHCESYWLPKVDKYIQTKVNITDFLDIVCVHELTHHIQKLRSISNHTCFLHKDDWLNNRKLTRDRGRFIKHIENETTVNELIFAESEGIAVNSIKADREEYKSLLVGNQIPISSTKWWNTKYPDGTSLESNTQWRMERYTIDETNIEKFKKGILCFNDGSEFAFILVKENTKGKIVNPYIPEKHAYITDLRFRKQKINYITWNASQANKMKFPDFINQIYL